MAHRTTASASASSSSAAYSASTHFQVFINHRGPDVKNTFAAHLYRSLRHHHGLQVFLDQPELQAGNEIDSQIKEAIQVASVHIAIFSKKYATSKWCLDELCLMVDSEKRGATILPVFYKVKPSELRWTGTDKDGPYAKALREHEEKQRYDSRTIQSWREALSHVADISGFELKACNGNEAELLDKVVQSVLTKVPKPALYVAKYATGLGEIIEDFEKTVLFQQEQQPVEAKVVGIAGLGGIGKTTLATEFFNCKRSHYAGSSFLADVREKASRSFLPSLQSKLIKDLKGINREIERWEEGIGILKTCLSSCHALIILDDVDDADQLEAFLPIKGVLDPKSLILVTSRNKHVLRSAGIEKSSIYHLKGLNKQYSQELFCSHAFFKPYPRPGFENLVDRFVDGCDGLPLSLKVFGALLCEMDKSFWEEKLNELQRLPDKILATLKISYDSLNEEEQQIFLDIACFAIGEERDKWVSIWGGSAGLQTLEDRCLVELSVELSDNLLGIRNHTDSVQRMRMHDHLRDMGRDIAKAVSIPRRLWRSIEDVHDLFEEQSSSSVSALIISDFVSMSTSFKFFSINKLARYYVIILFLKNQQVIPQVRGIRMPSLSIFGITEERLLRSKSEIPLNKFSSQKAFKMRKLQLLESGGEFVEGILSRVQSPNLTWLRWNDCPCSSLPSWIPMDHLRVLEVQGRELKNLWHCDSQAPLQLRELYVDAPLLEFPKSIGKLKYLEKIVVHYSNRFTETDLSTLPEEFFHVRSLKHLELAGCFAILPKEFGNLTNLQHLKLSGCDRLKRLPKSFGDLTNLHRIMLDTCESLEVLPDSFGNLTNLQQIELFGCNRLKRLPNSLGDLTNLHGIILSTCESLEVLPDSLGNLTNLQQIGLFDCNRLKRLPNSVGNLTNLHQITLQTCKSLEVLPNSFGNLTNLQYIELNGCESLEVLPDSFGNLTNLQGTQISGCKRLNKFPDSFGSLTKLQYINLIDCHSLKTLPDSFGNLTNLIRIRLSGCESLEKLPGSWGNLTKLRFMHLSGCKSLKKLPNSLGELTNLECIDLSGCKSLKKLPISLGELTNLENINLLGTNLKELTNAHAVSLRNLKYLSLGSPLLKELPPSLGCLSSLEALGFHGCQELKRLPDSVGLFTQLTTLEISKCGIHHLPGLMEMNNLQTLRVLACPLRELPFKEESAPRRKIKRRAKDKGLTGLKELELYCTEISEVSFPEDVCINLQRLYIRCCNDLVKVGSLPATLDHLILKGCGALRKIEGLFGLAELDIRGCYNIQVEELPHFENFKRLLTPADTDNHQDEEYLEKKMAALQEGVALPMREGVALLLEMAVQTAQKIASAMEMSRK